jgi:hypothetical protein
VTLRKIAEVLGVNYFELRQVMKGGDTKWQMKTM